MNCCKNFISLFENKRFFSFDIKIGFSKLLHELKYIVVIRFPFFLSKKIASMLDKNNLFFYIMIFLIYFSKPAMT